MTAEERAALIDRLAPLIIEERRKAAEQNPKRPPWYMVNIAHPVMGWLYNQYTPRWPVPLQLCRPVSKTYWAR